LEAAIELKNVKFTREGYTLLRETSLVFPKGKTTIIMGISGSGRSTLLKIAAGLILPDEGSVFINGKDFGKMSEKELLKFRGASGFVFQDSALWANLSAYQNISLPLQFHNRKMTPWEIDQRVQHLVKEFDFRDNLQLRPVNLSAGERKVVSFIRALVLDPDVLFMDEPSSFIDNTTGEKILRILKRLKGRERTLLIATHNPILTSQLGDYLVVLKDGGIEEHGEIKQVIKSKNPYVMEVLSEILSEAATYDTDLLDLLEADSDSQND
jgi:phospholipid/cholesterol/gamma-HCH transport system ATP-binding protein